VRVNDYTLTSSSVTPSTWSSDVYGWWAGRAPSHVVPVFARFGSNNLLIIPQSIWARQYTITLFLRTWDFLVQMIGKRSCLPRAAICTELTSKSMQPEITKLHAARKTVEWNVTFSMCKEALRLESIRFQEGDVWACKEWAKYCSKMKNMGTLAYAENSFV
jgi:hypothetical protein